MSGPWDRPPSSDPDDSWPSEDLREGSSGTPSRDGWPPADPWGSSDSDTSSGWGAWPPPSPPEESLPDDADLPVADPWAESWTDDPEAPAEPIRDPAPREPEPWVSREPARAEPWMPTEDPWTLHVPTELPPSSEWSPPGPDRDAIQEPEPESIDDEDDIEARAPSPAPVRPWEPEPEPAPDPEPEPDLRAASEADAWPAEEPAPPPQPDVVPSPTFSRREAPLPSWLEPEPEESPNPNPSPSRSRNPSPSRSRNPSRSPSRNPRPSPSRNRRDAHGSPISRRMRTHLVRPGWAASRCEDAPPRRYLTRSRRPNPRPSVGHRCTGAGWRASRART